MLGLRALGLLTLVLALAACGVGGSDEPASASSASAKLVRVGTFSQPVYMTAPPGDRSRLFVVEQPGRIIVLVNGRRRATPFLDIRSKVTAGGEQGLLSMAFSPDFARTRKFYVYYTDRGSNQRVAEFKAGTANRNRAVRSSERRVLVMDDPEGNHNGGQLQFGRDGMLYVGTGDGGGADDQHGARGNSQNLGNLLGKILRIDPRRGASYRIPASNPFVRRAGARREIWSYGLRNPWRFSFDRQTGDMIIGDVGQNAFEEIDFAPRSRGLGRGANYGWRPFEGNRRNFSEPAPGAVRPVFTLSHNGGNCSVTGGYVVRDRALPALLGRYVFADFCAGELRALRLRPGGASGGGRIGLRVESVSSFGEDGRGRVYVSSLGGAVYRLAAR